MKGNVFENQLMPELEAIEDALSSEFDAMQFDRKYLPSEWIPLSYIRLIESEVVEEETAINQARQDVLWSRCPWFPGDQKSATELKKVYNDGLRIYIN